MDLVTKTHQALSPETSSSSLFRHPSFHSSKEPSFPIIAIAVIGILATAFLLVSYYIFVIKCCLNWHRIDILGRFSLSRSRSHEELLMIYTPGNNANQTRGLEESVIRSIPSFYYKNDAKKTGNDIPNECAVCLNEFRNNEKLRIIPICRHVFHIDCIDVWLQDNANCPLCRTSVSGDGQTIVQSPYAGSLAGGDEEYVVIELTGENNNAGRYESESTRVVLPDGVIASGSPAKKGRKFTSMGDECIEMSREKDERFSVQPIRRSFSMDSSADRKTFMAIQEAVRRNGINGAIVSPSEGNRSVRRSFFSFGHGGSSRGSSRSAILPLYLEP